ncbi:MAG: hypothetical protein KA524_04890 [Nitrosomonas sp.]|nr:hypothetical protein [Nitrosomonas sp.]MBP6076072.1 hypothetical protein [Nitrosomonas sp.]
MLLADSLSAYTRFASMCALMWSVPGKKFLAKIGQAEPLIGIANVATENLVENYQYRLEDLTVTPFQRAAESKSQ